MESNLVDPATMPLWDEALMRALSQASAPGPAAGLVIGVEDDAGDVYRLVRTSGLYETVRLFESARELGFSIRAGRATGSAAAHRILRRPRQPGT